MARIMINGVSFDPATHTQALRAAGLESADATRSDYILIQTSGPLSSSQQDELTHPATFGLV
jgi:serine protease AprX